MQDKTLQMLGRIAVRLKEKGERFTTPRRNVMGALLEHGKVAKAYDIIEMIEQDVKPMTVYRALDFLSAQGLVHRIESMNAYAVCVEDHCEHKDSQYLICDTCEKIEELHNHKIDHLIADAVEQHGFTVHTKSIEIHGMCKDCG